ncbi:MAG TPA: GNAT family N-acetyltransferase [Acidimicrobiales bacterium]|nr:GNAT family N-acetyltransferase [Acidimicrobiales bacterium]
MTGPATPQVRDVRGEERFVFEDGGAAAELVYRTEPGRLVLVHTEVPEHLGGQGVGGRLVRAAVDRAAAEDLTVVPLCPFARRWLGGHPEVAAAVTVDWESPPGAALSGTEADRT